MARITVEDCVLRVPSRFELVMVAAQRARDISAGAQLSIDRDNDKNPVVALREIADETLSPDDLKEDLIHSLQKHVEIDEPEPDASAMISTADSQTETSDAEDDVPETLNFDQMSEEELLAGIEGLVRQIEPEQGRDTGRDAELGRRELAAVAPRAHSFGRRG